MDLKSPRGTSSLKKYYLKYKKENEIFKDVYYTKYLKASDSRRDTNLDFFDKKYNYKTIFKVRKNYDYFIENNLDFDMDIKSNKNNNNNKNFPYKIQSSNNLKVNRENIENEFDINNYKKIIESNSITSKITDKKRLEILYKYDDLFKMKMENIRHKKDLNLYDYQNKIVILLNNL